MFVSIVILIVYPFIDLRSYSHKSFFDGMLNMFLFKVIGIWSWYDHLKPMNLVYKALLCHLIYIVNKLND